MLFLINPGHGYKNNGQLDTGAIGAKGLKEYEQVMEVARELQTLLKNVGHEVVIFQDGDLWDVVAYERLLKPDYMISLHCDAFADRSVSGASVYVCGLGGKAEKLAVNIVNRISKDMKTHNRGVKVARFTVIAETNSPAVLVEMEFISNPAKEAEMMKRSVDADYAYAIFKGIVDSVGGNAICPTCRRLY